MKYISLFVALAAAIACTEQPESPAKSALADPSGLKSEQTDLTTVRLVWTDNADGERGYRIFLRGETDPSTVPPVAEIEAGATTFIFEGLTNGAIYDFGVQALSDDISRHSQIVYLNDCKVLTLNELAGQENSSRIEAPSELEAIQEGNRAVKLTWKDNTSEETGYNLFLRKATDQEFAEIAGTVQADVCEYSFKGLTAGEEYIFGVQAEASSVLNNSTITTCALKLTDIEKRPEVTEVRTDYACLAVSYKVQKLSEVNPEHGVCFSASGVPDVNGIKVPGPNISAGKEILQVIPNSLLEDGVEYSMSVYVRNGDEFIYSTPQSVALESQPDALTFDWKEESYPEAAPGVKIFRTESPLEDRAFNAWYAVADPSEVDFRVMYPEAVKAKKTVAEQAESDVDCLALINGAIFGNYNIGVIITEGKMTQEWHGEIEGCYWGSDSQLYQITRPVIGVDAEGKPGAYWVGVPAQNQFHYYTSPMPTVVGQAKYGKASADFPYSAVSWKPYYAISCGPMLIYDGKVMVNHLKVGEYFMTNYECWSETGVYYGNPDRTAVGITDDGKMILFVCDGRIDASKGAYLTELAQIMKGLGCRYAMNLDGGGSTGMWVKGAGMINHLDGSNWRDVKSTLGFFKK